MRWVLLLGGSFLFVLIRTSAFSASPTFNFKIAQTQFDIVTTGGQLSVSDSDVHNYVQRAATAVNTYFGHFPLKHVNLDFRVISGDRVRGGRSSPWHDGTITVGIGRDTSAETLLGDWTLTHEMVHLAFPATREDNREWIGEGMATYIEPVARAQCGYLTPEEVWKQFVNNMHKGLPQPGDQGMDNTPTWGRTYWGGGLFWLMADIEIRKKTHNRTGVREAFRTIMNEDGTMLDLWPTWTIFETGDRATGTRVLTDMYVAWKDKPVNVDLDKLWKDLGIEEKGDTVIFHDAAPYAAIRKAITARR